MLEKIESVLNRKGLSQSELERLACLPAGRISKWKDDKGEPSARQALRIATILGVPPLWLIDDEMEEPPAPAPVLSPAEERAVEMVRALGLGVSDVIRGLSTVAPLRGASHPAPPPVHPHTGPAPPSGVLHTPSISPLDDGVARRRKPG